MLMAVYHLKPWDFARLTHGELTELVNQLPDVQRTMTQVEIVRFE